MVTLVSLWLPILISAVVVFLLSSVIHMLLPYHRTDFAAVPDEDALQNALRTTGIGPGDYVIPHALTAEERKTPEFQEKMSRGPVALITVLPAGQPSTGKSLVTWFVFCVVVGVFAAYVSGRALAPGAEYLEVFRFTCTTAFLGYALALWQNSIWYGRKWSTVLKSTVDGGIYALATAGIFGSLWPS